MSENEEHIETTTQRKMAAILGVTVANLRHWRDAHEDAPMPVNRHEPVEAWKAWYALHKEELQAMSRSGVGQLKDLKAEGERLKNERIKGQITLDQEKIKVLQGQYIPREEVETRIAPLVSELIMLIDERDVELSNWAPGRTTGEIRAYQKETRDVMFQKIREGVSTFIDEAQSTGRKQLADEASYINAPGAGRPKGKKDSVKRKARKPKQKQ